MDRQRGEFIILVAEMFNFEPLTRLLEYPGTHWKLLKQGEYVLHSFFSGTDIVASMNLYLAVNFGGSDDESKETLDTIVHHMRNKACSPALLT